MKLKIFVITFVVLLTTHAFVLAANIEISGGNITAYNVPSDSIFMTALYRDNIMIEAKSHSGSGTLTLNPTEDFSGIRETDTIKAFLWNRDILRPLCDAVTTNMKEINDSDNIVEITVNGYTFTAVLYDNETAKAFKSMLPMTITMNELNRNEKYYYFDSSLPTDSTLPGIIKEGDLMLYGSSCLVLFYETFQSSYSYTKIGYIDDTTGLKNILGSGNVTVTYE